MLPGKSSIPSEDRTAICHAATADSGISPSSSECVTAADISGFRPERYNGKVMQKIMERHVKRGYLSPFSGLDESVEKLEREAVHSRHETSLIGRI